MQPLYAESAPDVVNLYPIASEKWVEQEREYFYNIFYKRRETQVLAYMSYLNNICYFPLNDALITEEFDGKERLGVDRDKLNIILAASDEGKLEVSVSNMWQQKYSRRYWDGAAYSGNAIRRARRDLSRLGLFKFDAVDPGSTWEPPRLKNIDFVRCLIAYEACERVYVDRFGWDIWDDRDGHKGATMVALFNATFLGFAQFRRKNDGLERSEGEVIVGIDASDPQVRKDLAAKYCPAVFTIGFWKDRFKHHVSLRPKPKKQAPPLRSLIDPYLHQLIPY